VNEFQPFPVNLMMGFYATADSSQPLRTDLDNELEGTSSASECFSFDDLLARHVEVGWYTRSEVLSFLRRPNTTPERAVLAAGKTRISEGAGPGTSGPVADQPLFRLPAATSISGILIREWAEGRIANEQRALPRLQKGNL
jgi:NAD+ diphosphatase